MRLTDSIKTLRERGFVRVDIPGEDDQYEIRADLLADDTPAITLDSIELLAESDSYDTRAWKADLENAREAGKVYRQRAERAEAAISRMAALADEMETEGYASDSDGWGHVAAREIRERLGLKPACRCPWNTENTE